MTGTVLQLRGGTAAESDAFTGQTREVTVDTTNKRLRVHDGTTPGGTAVATLADAKQAGVIWGGTAGGTANALAITPNPAVAALVAGMRFAFVAASANTGTAPTLAVSGLAAAAIKTTAGGALVAGQIAAGSVVDVVYDGAAFRLVADAAYADNFLGFRNRLINSGFLINQRSYTSGNSLSAGVYGHDRWKAGSAGVTVTFSGVSAPSQQITITAGSYVQVIEGLNLEAGTFTLSWKGTAQAKINGGTAGSSPMAFTQAAGAATTVEFLPGTLQEPQFARGTRETPWEVRPVTIEIALCQRYYCFFDVAAGGAYPSGGASPQSVGGFSFPVVMRAAPTVTGGTLTLDVNVSGDSFSTVTTRGGFYLVTGGASSGNYYRGRSACVANAEL